MAKRTSRNSVFLSIIFVLTATFVWACPNGGYNSPTMRDPKTHPGSDYGTRVSPGGIGSTFHGGWDLDPNNNRATSGGVVSVGTINGYGNVVTITNGNFKTVYAHACSVNSSLNNKTISAGQVLGDWSSCCSGNCTGNHVHYETQVQSSSGAWSTVDPAIVQSMVASGADPCSSTFADQAIAATKNKHKAIASGVGAPGGTPTNGPTSGGNGTCA